MLPAPAALSIAPPGRGICPRSLPLSGGPQVSLSLWLLPASLLGGEGSVPGRGAAQKGPALLQARRWGGGQGDTDAGGYRGVVPRGGDIPPTCQSPAETCSEMERASLLPENRFVSPRDSPAPSSLFPKSEAGEDAVGGI